MNYGIIISYIIAGFLMLTILTVNYNVNYSNQEVTTTLNKTTHERAIKEMLIHDIPKIGYDRKTVLATKFAKADSNELTFFSNIDDQGAAEQVTWKYTDTPAPGSKNPNDHILRRTVDSDVTEITFGVTSFKFNYYDSYGSNSPMSTPVSSSDYDNIVQIEVEMQLQSDYELAYRPSNSGEYIQTNWSKRFSPVNLRSNK